MDKMTRKPKSVEELEIIKFPDGAIAAKFRNSDEFYLMPIEVYPLWTAA